MRLAVDRSKFDPLDPLNKLIRLDSKRKGSVEPTVRQITNLSKETIRERYGSLVVQLSERYHAMTLGDAINIQKYGLKALEMAAKAKGK
jgi:hypothetical protein